MSILDCVKGKVAKGIQRELEDEYDELIKTMTAAEADVELMTSFAARANNMKKVEVMSALKVKEVLADIDDLLAFKRAEYDAMNEVAQGVARLLRRKPSHAAAADEIYSRAANSGQVEITKTMERMGLIHENVTATGMSFSHDTKLFAQVFDGLIDGLESVKDSAVRGMVKEVRGATDLLLKEYKAQGGIIGEVENYVPLRHARQKVADGNKQDWIDAYIEMNDIPKMKDFKTGKTMTEERLRELADDMYDDIVSNGAKRKARELTRTGGRSKDYVPRDLFSRRMQHRLSKPKNAAAYKKYNDIYGTGEDGLYDLYLGSMREMAHDVGVMKVMGPQPLNLSNTMIKHAAANGANARTVASMNAMYRTLVGAWEGSADNILATGTQAMQGILSSSLLGTASVSALGDTLMISTAKQLAGLGGVGKGGVDAYISALAGNPKDITRAIHMMESMAHTQVSRYLEGDMGALSGRIPGMVNKVKNMNHRLSGLHRITLAGGDAMSLTLASGLGELVDKGLKFADLPKDFRGVLIRNGLNEGHWKRLVAHGTDDAGFITRGGLKDGMEDIGERVGTMEVMLRAWATNSPELRTRMYSTGNLFGAQVQGGAGHALASSIMQFKSFPLQVWRNHFTPAMIKAADGDVAPLATLVIGGAFLGGIIVQLKELLKGNPPLEWDDGALWMRGLVQSGAAGMLGDVMLKDPEQYKRTLLGELAGPALSYSTETVLEAFKVAKNAGYMMAGSDEADVDWKPIMRAVRTAIPLSTLWYLKAGIERGAMDALNTMVDPDYYETIQRRENRFQEERGQRSYYDQKVRSQ